jgi:CxxC motif-containing protein (DUF1111 family)
VPLVWSIFRPLPFASVLSVAAILGACSSGPPGASQPPGADAGRAQPDAGGTASAPDAGEGGTTFVSTRLDQTFIGATTAQFQSFTRGDALFDTPFAEVDGLGPLYVNVACGLCHENGLRGTGFDQRMVMVDADGITTAADQSPIEYGNEIRKLMAAGATTPVVPPDLPNVKVTIRTPPAILGRGYIEAVMDSEITRVAAEQAQRTDAIHGKVNYVAYGSQTTADPAFFAYTFGQTVIGRFGLKARVATLDDFAADAFQNDMGITSPLRPTELPNPDGLTDDEKPGVDTDLPTVDAIATYMRLTAIPTRPAPDPMGVALFDQCQCSACHVPTLKTRADYPIAQLAGIDAPIFTDLLLHDMGPALADGMQDGQASSTQYRTSPLIGMKYMLAYLNDGRAHTITDAISQHGGEATASVAAYQGLSDADRATLDAYVSGL